MVKTACITVASIASKPVNVTDLVGVVTGDAKLGGTGVDVQKVSICVLLKMLIFAFKFICLIKKTI